MSYFEFKLENVQQKVEGYPSIYLLFNSKNKMIYVGQSIETDERLKEHLRRLKRGREENFRLQEDFKNFSKYFQFRILEMIDPTLENLEEYLIEKERYWINTITQDKLYNKLIVNPNVKKSKLKQLKITPYAKMVLEQEKMPKQTYSDVIINLVTFSSNYVGIDGFITYLKGKYPELKEKESWEIIMTALLDTFDKKMEK